MHNDSTKEVMEFWDFLLISKSYLEDSNEWFPGFIINAETGEFWDQFIHKDYFSGTKFVILGIKVPLELHGLSKLYWDAIPLIRSMVKGQLGSGIFKSEGQLRRKQLEKLFGAIK